MHVTNIMSGVVVELPLIIVSNQRYGVSLTDTQFNLKARSTNSRRSWRVEYFDESRVTAPSTPLNTPQKSSPVRFFLEEAPFYLEARGHTEGTGPDHWLML